VRRFLSRFRREEGAALVEFALVSSVAFGLIFGMADMGLVVLGNTVGSNAARDGARVGMINYVNANDPADPAGNYNKIQSAVLQRLSGTVSNVSVTVRCLDAATGAQKPDPQCGAGTVALDQDLIEVKVNWTHHGSVPFIPTTHSGTARMVIGGSPDLSASPPPPNTPPHVISIARVGPGSTGASSVSWTVDFDKTVTGVDVSDFTLASTGLSGATKTGVNASSGPPSSSWTVTASTGTCTGVCTLGLNLVDDDSIRDTQSPANPLGGTGLGNGNFTGEVYTIVPTDLTPPTGSLTAPLSGAVSGTVAVTATASDAGSGVASVQFQYKLTSGSTYTNIGAADTTSPYGVNWDSTSVANGSYNLVAFIIDNAGNSFTTGPVTVTVGNGAQAPAITITSFTAGNGHSVTVAGTGGHGPGDTLTATVVLCTVNSFPCSASNTKATLTASINAVTGAWTVSSGNIGNGTVVYARAEQSNSAGNTGVSAVAGPTTA
jgi:Flp pilus assembly protein TadG